MSDRESNNELNPVTTNFVEAVAMPDNPSTPTHDECFKAKVLRTAYDIPPTKIPEDFEAVNLDGYRCPFVNEDGKECTFADPMVLLKHGIGLVAMGSSNFCELESDSPRNFKKASLGSVSIRAIRFGKHLNAFVKQKFAE